MTPIPDASSGSALPAVVSLVRAMQEHADLLEQTRHLLSARAGDIQWVSRAAGVMHQELNELTMQMSDRAGSLRSGAENLLAYDAQVTRVAQLWQVPAQRPLESMAGMW